MGTLAIYFADMDYEKVVWVKHIRKKKFKHLNLPNSGLSKFSAYKEARKQIYILFMFKIKSQLWFWLILV